MRFFNTARPCNPEWHDMLPAAERLPQARRPIERGAYFVVRAPRQMGKTTTLRTLAAELTAEGGAPRCLSPARKDSRPATASSNRSSEFTREQVAALYAQHTAEAGQEFLCRRRSIGRSR